MKNKITRKDKKKLRAIILCHTGNPECRNSKYSKIQWLKIRETYNVWFKTMDRSDGMKDRKMANTVKFKNSK